MRERWFRYGLVGNTIIFGGTALAVWLTADIILSSGKGGAMMEERLAKELFQYTPEEAKKRQAEVAKLENSPEATEKTTYI